MEQQDEIPECTIAIGRKFYPSLYRRGAGRRDINDAAELTRNLDWRNNPYDRFLVKREIVQQYEARSKYPLAPRIEIERAVEIVMQNFSKKLEHRGILFFALMFLNWSRCEKNGRVHFEPLLEMLSGLTD